ncbi:hypothetical protein BK011_06790 [Tenericutes bacterium MZ-XQ]|nr:hypothetical protein BK011_06790 [Tenericutes bacterium MZ-XQ]
MYLEKLKRLAKGAASRPILQGLCYRDDEILYTNSYVLIIEKNSRKVDEEFVVSLMNGKILSGNYPDLKSIKPSQDKLEKVTDIRFEIKPFKNPYYIANGIYFNKKEMETAFSCIGLKPFDLEVVDKIYVAKEKRMLVYDNQDKGQYVLVLGVRIE